MFDAVQTESDNSTEEEGAAGGGASNGPVSATAEARNRARAAARKKDVTSAVGESNLPCMALADEAADVVEAARRAEVARAAEERAAIACTRPLAVSASSATEGGLLWATTAAVL